ncbi:MAG: diguanylate cyclase, partial [Gammaproteobacteria bacterium]
MIDVAERIGKRFAVILFLGYLLTPIAGFTGAVYFGVISPETLLLLTNQAILPVAGIIFVFWTLIHFQRFITPFAQWISEYPKNNRTAPNHLHLKLDSFSREFWGFQVFYIVASAVLLAIAYPLSGLTITRIDMLQFIFLQISAALLAGLPAWQYAHNQLGSIASILKPQRVHASLTTRLVLLAGIIPLVTYLLIVDYFWLSQYNSRTAMITLPVILVAFMLATTWQAVRSVRQAFHPFRQLFESSGASTHSLLSSIQPATLDEIGQLTQTLGNAYQRIADKESHMRSIIDSAAEGIIVVDSKGLIDTFNAAAEELFGYSALEIRGKHISKLMPDKFIPYTPIAQQLDEIEVMAVHNRDYDFPASLRISKMMISGKRMFTCMVGDIRLRKQAEHNLCEAEKRYQSLVETAHDLVWTIDDNGCWSYLNASCQAIYGVSSTEMIGRPVIEFSSPECIDTDFTAFAPEGDSFNGYETTHLDDNGDEHHLSFNATKHFDQHGNITGLSGTARDITEQKAFQERLTYQAEHDSLTRLFNRYYFQQQLQKTIRQMAHNPNVSCALLYIDLDQFKYVNDTLGHAAGDKLLIAATNLLKKHCRNEDLLARFGGDEFTMLLYNISVDETNVIAERIRREFDHFTFIEESKTFNITCSIGISRINNRISDAEEALSQADIACNLAKAQGRNRYLNYDPAKRDQAGMAEAMGWASLVREMLERDRFQLVYQPIMSLHDNQVNHYEVLVRMLCDDGKIILPGDFIPASERFGLIHSLDRWIIKHALIQLGRLHQHNQDITFSINLSGKAFEDS